MVQRPPSLARSLGDPHAHAGFHSKTVAGMPCLSDLNCLLLTELTCGCWFTDILLQEIPWYPRVPTRPEQWWPATVPEQRLPSHGPTSGGPVGAQRGGGGETAWIEEGAVVMRPPQGYRVALCSRGPRTLVSAKETSSNEGPQPYSQGSEKPTAPSARKTGWRKRPHVSQAFTWCQSLSSRLSFKK